MNCTIRAQVAYILIMPWLSEQLNDLIFFSLVLLQGKKNFRAQHLDKKISHSRKTLKKKIHAARKFPAPHPPPTR